MALTVKYSFAEILRRVRRMQAAKTTKEAEIASELVAEAIHGNDEWAMRNLQWGPQEEQLVPVGGGGPALESAKLVGHIDWEWVGDKPLGVPMQRVQTQVMNTREKRVFIWFAGLTKIRAIVGFTDYESMLDQRQLRKFVHLTLASGSSVVPPMHGIDVVIKFERFGDNRGKLFLLTHLFTRNSLHADADTPLPGTEAIYMSDEVVLDSAWMTDYDTKNGGSGIKMDMTIDLWGA